MSSLNRDMSLTSGDPSDLFSPYSYVMDVSEVAADRMPPGTMSNDVNSNGWQSNPAMKGPRTMDTRKTSGPLQHQRSAKALITRYESMSSSERPRTIQRPFRNVAGRSLRPPEHSRNIKNPLPIVKNDKSPMRQSFRNLFSVFRKGNAVIKEVIKDKTSSSPEISFGGGNSIPLGSLSQPALDVPVTLPRVDDTSLYTGSLLYLSRVSTSPSTLPVWTTCTANLQNDRILITWLTIHGNPSCHVISLAQCDDVRSVLLSQISPDERALLPTKGDSHELKVFEILYEDKPTEKFAAASANERAGWVCAIWDAILPSREGKEIGSDEIVTTQDTGLIISNNVAQNQTEHDLDAAQSQTNLPPSPSRLERSLPPTPIDAMPPTLPAHSKGISLHDFPHRLRSPNALSPSPPVSRVSSTSSPSMANLGQLSVVRQRLAQIERINSCSSSVGPSSPCRSRLKDNPARLKDALAEKGCESSPSGLQHQTSLRSSGGDSIFDFYGEMASPYGDRSALLHMKASRRQRSEKRAHPLVHRECDSLKASWDAASPTGLFSPLSQYSATDEPTRTRLAEILQNDTRNGDQAANIGNQILSLQQDVQRLPEQLKALVVDPKQRPLLEAIDQTVRSIDQQAKEKKTEIRDLREILHGINETISGQVPPVGHGFEATAVNVSGPFQLLKELQLNLESNLPEVLRKLGEIQDAQTLANQSTGRETPALVMNNLKPFSPKMTDDALVAHMSEVHTKLDGLLALCDSRLASGNCDKPASRSSTGVTQVPEEFKEILTLLRGNENHRNVQERQQADCVRYLNELNLWLDTFVNNGTSQIQEVASSVQQLCNTLTCPPKSMGMLGVDADGTGVLLKDIHQLLLANQERTDNATTLQASVNDLVTAINQNANVFTMESVVDLINRQRHAQEGLFRALATELSDEIRGERLKFVEAMKSATSINVQLHVDQFKKELTREVLAMTQEVERLQQERHGIENQIADLLAFYSKQKQTGVPWTHPSPAAPSQNDAFRLRGPLPNPNSRFGRGNNRHY